MNCESYEDVLGDYVDGARASGLPGDARLAAFERHLAGCARCQALVADFTSIRGAAARLEEHVPPPRLWTRVVASIAAQQRRPWWRRPIADAFPSWAPVAVAVSLALSIAGATWLAWKQEPAQAPHEAVGGPAEPEAAPAEQPYEAAIAGLEQLAASQDASLDADTRAVLKQNLAVLDRAISESRAALADEPANALAQDSLLDALDTKVALLQDTVALAADADTVSDDAAGAAKELNQ